MNFFPIDKLNSMENGIRPKMEKYLQWNNNFSLKYGQEKHDQHLKSNTNSTVEVYELFSENVPAFCKKTHLILGPGTVSKE